jgi:hypothetical protein
MHDGLLVCNGDSGAVYVMSHAVFAHTRMYDSMMREGDALIMPEGCGNTRNSRGCVCCFVGWLYIRLAVNTIKRMTCGVCMHDQYLYVASVQYLPFTSLEQSASLRAGTSMFKRMSTTRHFDNKVLARHCGSRDVFSELLLYAHCGSRYDVFSDASANRCCLHMYIYVLM